MVRRPLVGEPLALDLVNTRWHQGGVVGDILDDDASLAAWLDEHRLRGEAQGPPGGTDRLAGYRDPLRAARSAVRGVLEGRHGAANELDAVLSHARIRLGFADGLRDERIDLDDEAWRPAWRAARAYLELTASAPADRIRHCDGVDCVLWFLDTSRNGGRRWCSMMGCGNRAKASAHYRRHRNAPRPLP